MPIDYSKLHSVTAREIIRALIADGFTLKTQRGSHQRYQHSDGRHVTVPHHGSGTTFVPKALRSRRPGMMRIFVGLGYFVKVPGHQYMVHAFQKKSTQGIKFDQGPTEETEGDVAMKSEKLEVVRESGNIFRDLGHENADAQQRKAILAAEIIKALDWDRLSVRETHSRTGIAAADFSRIRNADLGRSTLDRLMSITNRLGSRVEVKIKMRLAEAIPHEATA